MALQQDLRADRQWPLIKESYLTALIGEVRYRRQRVQRDCRQQLKK